MLTNKGLKQIIDTYKERVNSISLNNGKYLFLGYENSPTWDQIDYVTIDGCDFIKVPHIDISHNPKNPIKFHTLITTEFIEGIDIMDEGYEDYRIDPLRLK